MPEQPLVYLVKGSSVPLVAEAARQLIEELSDPVAGVVAEEFAGDSPTADVLDACSSMPFLSPRRLVVLRDAGNVGKGDSDTGAAVDAVVRYVSAPADFTTLVVVAGGGATSQKIVNAVKKHGEIIDVDPGKGKARTAWVSQRIKDAPVSLTSDAVAAVNDHLGEDVGSLPGLLDRLVALYGEGARVDVDRLVPVLGSAGAIPPWDLTDAIDVGDTDRALSLLRRIMVNGERHPLAVMAIIQSHYMKMLSLDGSGARNSKDAAAIVGGAPFMAEKALRQANRLGSAALFRAVQLLSQADLDLKGGSQIGGVAGPMGVDGSVVMEVLVARLSKLGGGR